MTDSGRYGVSGMAPGVEGTAGAERTPGNARQKLAPKPRPIGSAPVAAGSGVDPERRCSSPVGTCRAKAERIAFICGSPRLRPVRAATVSTGSQRQSGRFRPLRHWQGRNRPVLRQQGECPPRIRQHSRRIAAKKSRGELALTLCLENNNPARKAGRIGKASVCRRNAGLTDTRTGSGLPASRSAYRPRLPASRPERAPCPRPRRRASGRCRSRSGRGSR